MSRTWMQSSLATYLRYLAREREQDANWIGGGRGNDLRRYGFKISEIPKYLQAEHIGPIERKTWTELKRR